MRSECPAPRGKSATRCRRVLKRCKRFCANDPDNHYLIWHDLEAERHAIEKAIPGVVSVYGSLELEQRERNIIRFSDGEFPYLAGKPSIMGAGCNFQRHCHKAIFLGIDFKFNNFVQAIHRIQRFMQPYPVEIHIIFAESEQAILRTLLRKWEQHKTMVARMSEIIKQFGLSHAAMKKSARARHGRQAH